MPKVEDFLIFLEQRCQILQIVAINLNMNSNHSSNSSNLNKKTNYRIILRKSKRAWLQENLICVLFVMLNTNYISVKRF